MKTTTTIFLSFLLLHIVSYSQVFISRSGNISFFSSTEKETIHAVNNQAYAIIDVAKKNIAFAVLIKSFQFDKELMQVHFNENYAESDKYPKATFSGSYIGEVDITKDGVYQVNAKGNLTFHNVTRLIETPCTIEVKNNTLIGNTKFTLKPEDYNITIPFLVREKIAKEITVSVTALCTSK